MTCLVAEPRESAKALSKAKHEPKNVMVTAWWSAASVIHYSFLNPSKTIVSESTLSKLMRYAEKSAMPAAGMGQQKGPDSSPWQSPATHHATNASKVERTGLRICFIHHIHLSSRQLSLLQASQQLFAGKTFQQPAGGRICFPRVC